MKTSTAAKANPGTKKFQGGIQQGRSRNLTDTTTEEQHKGVSELSWHESRTDRDGVRETVFFRCEKTPSGWEVWESSSGELQWFAVSSPHRDRLIERAELIMGEQPCSPTGSPKQINVEVGNASDNLEVLERAQILMGVGRASEAAYILEVLKHHIETIADAKSAFLLPQVETSLRRAVAMLKAQTETVAQSTADTQSMADSSAAPKDPPPEKRGFWGTAHQVKTKVIDAATIVTAFTYVHGLLVHDFLNLPGFSTYPIFANVAAGSVLAIVMRFLVPRSG